MRRSFLTTASLLLALLLVALFASDDFPSEPAAPPRLAGDRSSNSFTLPARFAAQSPFQPRVEVVATNLEVPWALAFAPSVAPSGATFYDGDQLSDWTGNLFFATLRGQHLHLVVLGAPNSRQVISDERLFEGVYGRLRDVVQGPDGFLYFCTSNRDGRGNPTADDDRILRIVPQ